MKQCTPFFLFAILLSICNHVVAKEFPTKRHKLPDFGYVFELTSQVQQITGQTSNLLGVRAGLTFNTHYNVGVSFKFSTNRIFPTYEPNKEVFLNVALTSAYLEYTVAPSKRLNVVLPIDIGGGDVNMEWIKYRSNNTFPYDEKYFFFVEPGAKLEYSITKNIKVNLGATFLYVPKLSYRAVNEQNISGPTAIIGVKYGKFL